MAITGLLKADDIKNAIEACEGESATQNANAHASLDSSRTPNPSKDSYYTWPYRGFLETHTHTPFHFLL